jgi:ATP-dependent helicase/nuclease subunit B
LAAHDFQLAAAGAQVVLSRARRDAEAETVASRWVNRLVNLVAGLPGRDGPRALEEMRARGKIWLDRAATLERPTDAERVDPAPRPSPRPPVSARPEKLSLTQVETLIRNPYAIYARHVLRLKPLDPMRPGPDPRLRGIVLHKVMEAFVQGRRKEADRASERQRMLNLTARILADEVAWPSARVLWQARMESTIDAILDFEAANPGEPLAVEVSGDLALSGLNFRLVGRPDRIDILPSAKARLIDYKTGTVPTELQQKTYAKQLLLAAVMAEDGGFAALGPLEVDSILYLGLKEGLPDRMTPITPEDLDQERNGLRRLIGKYAQQSQGYTARRAMFLMGDASDYDALSRFGEWDISSDTTGEDVG